jgi:hypothetical protein
MVIINTYRNLVEDRERKDHLEDLDVDGKIILDWILRKQGEKV